MPNVLSIATAVPEHRYSQRELRDAAALTFPKAGHLEIFDHAGIEYRHLCFPLEYYRSGPDFERRNNDYIAQGTELAVRASEQALAGLDRERVGHVIFLTTTGLATPSLDARLVNRLGLGLHVKRTPIFGVGCAAGTVGLGRAADLASDRVLLVSVELCGQNFNLFDTSTTAIVGTALFGDGVAAAVIGDGVGPQIVDSQSVLFPDSLDVMGWDFTNTGPRLVLSREIPAIVRRRTKENVTAFLARHRAKLADVRHFVVHPGSSRVLEAFEESLDLGPGALDASRTFLRDYGNLSSASVLFILKSILPRARPDDLGIVVSVGPGFAMELVLLRW